MNEHAKHELTVIIPTKESPIHTLVGRGGDLPTITAEKGRIPGEAEVTAFGRRVLRRFLSPDKVGLTVENGRTLTTKPVTAAKVTEGEEYWWIPTEALDGRTSTNDTLANKWATEQPIVEKN